LALLVPATALTVVPAFADAYGLAKLAFFLLLVALLTVAVVLTHPRTSALELLRSPAGALLAAFVLALAVSAALAPSLGKSLMGAYGRDDGLVAVVALVIVSATLITIVDERATAAILGSVALTSVVVIAVEVVDLLMGQKSGPRSTIGNPDFLAGWLATAGVICIGWALAGKRVGGAHAAVLVVGAVDVIAAILTRAQQGPAAAVLGLLVTAIAWGRATHRLSARQTVFCLAGLFLFVALLAWGALGGGPLSAIGTQGTVVNRRLYWHVATSVFASHPVFGGGLGSFGDYYFRYWPLSATVRLGDVRFADAANSVPLNYFAEGGVLLGVSYLVVMGYVAYRMLRGLVRWPDQARRLLPFAGGWVAYQAQSVVSVDKLPTMVLGWLCLGAIVAFTRSDSSSYATAHEANLRVPNRARIVAAVALGAAVLVACVPFARLLVANTDLARSEHAATSRFRYSDALHAASLASWSPTYVDAAAQAALAVGDPQAARSLAIRSLGDDPHDHTAYLTLISAAIVLHRYREAHRLLRESWVDDRHDPARLQVHAQLAIALGHLRHAVALLRASQWLHRSPEVKRYIHQLVRQMSEQPSQSRAAPSSGG
jgi:hypothetical protein